MSSVSLVFVIVNLVSKEVESRSPSYIKPDFAQSVFKSNNIPPISSARFGSPGEIRTPVDGFLPYSNGPKPVTGRASVPLLVRYTTGLQSTLAID